MIITTNEITMREPLGMAYCGHCGTLDNILRIPDEKICPKKIVRHRIRTQIKLLISYCDSHYPAIPVTENEREAAA